MATSEPTSHENAERRELPASDIDAFEQFAEAVDALARDPGNTYRSRHLANTVEKKVDVLGRAAQVARTEI